MKSCFVWLAGLLIFAGVGAQAVEYYVDIQNGSNQTGDGSQGNPWRNIVYALGQFSGTGHTVHVAPGVYSLTPDTGGIAEFFPITIETGVSIVGDQGPAVTIVDAQTTARVFMAMSISAGTTLQGLTIKNGRATDNGAGIFLNSSSLTIQDCIIESNSLPTSTTPKYGGGIYITGGAPIIDGCILRNNDITCSGSYNFSYGGGLYATASTPTITDNIITGNLTVSYLAYGGGLALETCTPGSVARNIIQSNAATSISSLYTAQGGGIYLKSSSVPVSRNIIIDNTLGSTGNQLGGGIFSYDSAPTITNNIVARNNYTGIYFGSSTTTTNYLPLVINNTISNNGSHGLHCVNNIDPTARNNIFYGNASYALYEGTTTSDITADSNVFHSNTSGVCYDEALKTVLTAAQLNLIAGNSGNLDGNPLFLDEPNDDYRITSGSPAKDAGSSTSAPTEDLDGEPRNDGSIDIGADEYYGPHAADTNANYVIENFEMLRWVDDWANSLITQGQLDELRTIWSCLNGYRSDGAGGFTCR